MMWSFIRLLLSPAVYAYGLWASLVNWGFRTSRSLMQLPYTSALVILAAAELLSGDLVAFLSRKPSTRQRLLDYEGELVQYKHLVKQQERRFSVVQAELGKYQAGYLAALEANEELEKQLRDQQQQAVQAPPPPARRASTSSRSGAPAAAAAGRDPVAAVADASNQTNTPTAAGQQVNREANMPAEQYGPSSTEQYNPVMDGQVQQGGKGRSGSTGGRGGRPPQESLTLLHISVALAAVCVRWWLLHLHDPLQRKILWVGLWPAVWLYGTLLLRGMRGSLALRQLLQCGCWALMGYVAHAMVQLSVIHSSGGLRAAAAGRPVQGVHWAHALDLAAGGAPAAAMPTGEGYS